VRDAFDFVPRIDLDFSRTRFVSVPEVLWLFEAPWGQSDKFDSGPVRSQVARFRGATRRYSHPEFQKPKSKFSSEISRQLVILQTFFHLLLSQSEECTPDSVRSAANIHTNSKNLK
jgi:hypothetical protein